MTILNQIKALEPEYKNVDELIVRTQTGLDVEAELAEIYDRDDSMLAMRQSRAAGA